MINRRHLLLLIAAAAATRASAELAVEGNEAFEDAQIAGAAYSGVSLDANAVEQLYLRAGYLDARVELTGEESPSPTLTVTEGPQYRVASLAVDNDSPLSRDQVMAFIPFGRGEPPSPPDLRAGLVALLGELAERGYLRAEAEYTVTDAGAARVDVDVAVRGGERYVAGEIGLLGVGPADEAAVRAKLETRPGRPLRERELARDLLAVIDYYRERGYPAASARPRLFKIAERYREIDFDLAVEPGAEVTVAVVEVVGNRRTRDAVIRRELVIVPGDPYDVARLRKSARRIYNLKYFAEEPTIELVDAEAGRVRVTVAERPTYRVTGALAYEPAEEDDAAALIGEMEARLANLAGTGRDLGARYRRLAKEAADASATYYEPWIGGVDLFAQPSGAYKERVTYRKASGEFALGTHPLVDLTVAGGGGFDRVWKENASRKYKVFTWATYDSRDRFENPRRGWQAFGRLELGVKEYLMDGFRERVPRLELDAWRFWPTGRSQVLATRFRAQGFVSQRPGLDEVYPLGGYADLRGFREEQFLTDRQALATTEYRFLTGPGGRLFLFVDTAYHHLKTEKTFDEGFNLGYGCGFRAATTIGTYGVDYGLAAGNGPLDGKIHVSVTQEF